MHFRISEALRGTRHACGLRRGQLRGASALYGRTPPDGGGRSGRRGMDHEKIPGMAGELREVRGLCLSQSAAYFREIHGSLQGEDPCEDLLFRISSCLKKDCDINQAFSFDKIDNLYTITLVHEPDTTQNILNNKTDLILAGHSLNGQIRLPLIGGIKKQENATKYPDSKYKINDTTLYVSGGLGTYKKELRLFNHPSINLYRLVKETN